MKIWPGKPSPLGATFDGSGTNFAIFSEVAERVELCLFDEKGGETHVDLPESSGFVWYGYLQGIMPGQRYGYRVHGPWDPARGLRCNPAKLLIDPYAKAVEGGIRWDDRVVFPFQGEDSFGPADLRDSAPYMPKCIVISPYYDWGNVHHPDVTLHEMIIYETHVRGLTMRNQKVSKETRGTYEGLASTPVIEYLKDLGVTTVELMPVHQFVHDNYLLDKGLRNYWGYNSIAYFAPHNEYSSMGQAGQQVQEFKHMVQRLHEADIEVILDVVYNHTAEGNHMGPMLSMKGIDNTAYYRVVGKDPRYYMDYTGTGNSLNMRHPNVLQLVMDSLRYWVTEMHVDGFRFDLASTLARELHDVDRLSAFFDIIHQDPVIGQAKLIAEPWDIGEGGYQVGKFPAQWSEWNGKYRDSIRDYWRGQDMMLGELAGRFTGSSDLYAGTGRRPYASINFITAHDGFTLRDLVSYDQKHNDANKNGGGEDNNRSWNCGAEGPAADAAINALRARQQRNLLATLILSLGIPMVLGGDEIGRTQHGNNNAYCQDNELSWYDWEHADNGLYDFVAKLIELRKEHPVFRRWKWFRNPPDWTGDEKEIDWFRPDGTRMIEKDWTTFYVKALTVFLSGNLNSLDKHGDPVIDDDFLILFNASPEPLEFTVPRMGEGGNWLKMVDTNPAAPPEPEKAVATGERVHLESRSVVVMRHVL